MLTAGPLYAAALETADAVPQAVSESDRSILAKEKAKLDELHQGLRDDIAQQNTECEQVAESNAFQVDLCRNRQSFLMGRIGSYKARLAEYRTKIKHALFMAPQSQSAVSGGLKFKNIPAPQNISSTPQAASKSVNEYFNNPDNNPRVQRAKDDADRFHQIHVHASETMLEQVNQLIADVRAKTVYANPQLGREEVDRIVAQDPEVRRVAATWYQIHSTTLQQAKDYEEDYEDIYRAEAKNNKWGGSE